MEFRHTFPSLNSRRGVLLTSNSFKPSILLNLFGRYKASSFRRGPAKPEIPLVSDFLCSRKSVTKVSFCHMSFLSNHMQTARLPSQDSTIIHGPLIGLTRTTSPGLKSAISETSNILNENHLCAIRLRALLYSKSFLRCCIATS